MLEELRKIALRFQIDPKSTIGHAAKLETVVKVLSEINKSYKNFLEIEFLKNSDFRKAFDKNKKTLETIIGELELLIVDVNFSSFTSAVAPNVAEDNTTIFIDEVLLWKKEKFDEYKEEIIKADYSSSSYIQRISKRYSDHEINKIFQPLFSFIGTGEDYKINIQSEDSKILKTLHQPNKSKVQYFVSKTKRATVEPEYKTVQAFMKIKPDESGAFNIKKSNIKETYYQRNVLY